MNAITLKNLYDTKGLAAVNAAIETLDDHAQLLLLEDQRLRS
ncbi:hypothetical protein [Agrobacterium rosae]|uniref:Transposase n=1 Tax=Agrobacterium rosae TaxID=1972867 RepID=A0A1R3U4Y6_9HYPH|nr:hypothetical protein [Agrobacterium rosae]SCX35998.1 hypothetical protein DSM25559_5271 [Agrobacterium rosae]